jgi:para-aminobenzoate synthetase component 1
MHTQELPYQNNSASLFERFVHLPYPVFFDSCLPQQDQGRYDIMTADPIAIVSGDSSAIFNTIHLALADLKHTAVSTTLPFTIGAIGYLSYDIGRSLEQMPAIALDDIALPKAQVGIYDWSIVVDHLQQKTYFNSLHGPDDPRIKNMLACFSKHKAAPETTRFSMTKPFTSNLSFAEYEKAFDTVKKNIVAGNCYQVNLAQRFSGEFAGSSWEAYQLLRHKNPAPYAAFMQLDDASILSLSPERFLKVTNQRVETKPIKGTSKRFTDHAQDEQSAHELLHSEKDRAENVMIVDLLRNDLSRICTNVCVEKLCVLESFSNVHHLVSTITAQLPRNQTALDLFTHCFPGGSITGAPKISAMSLIESLEPHRRSLYCGSLFYLDINGNCDSNIAIRTVICDKNNIHCYAGGGIVHDSDCNKEYAETWAKVGKIIDALQTL